MLFTSSRRIGRTIRSSRHEGRQRRSGAVMFGEDVTPNHHKLAREFVLLDNLYCNGHVSRDGHPWSTMAYNTDYIARDWALTYSHRTAWRTMTTTTCPRRRRLSLGFLRPQRLTYRSYGEYGIGSARARRLAHGRAVPGLVGHMCPITAFQRKAPKSATPRTLIFSSRVSRLRARRNLPRFIS